MLTLQFLKGVAILLWIYFLWSRRRFYRMMLKVPGPMGLPLIGLASEYLRLKRKLCISKKSLMKLIRKLINR